MDFSRHVYKWNQLSKPRTITSTSGICFCIAVLNKRSKQTHVSFISRSHIQVNHVFTSTKIQFNIQSTSRSTQHRVYRKLPLVKENHPKVKWEIWCISLTFFFYIDLRVLVTTRDSSNAKQVGAICIVVNKPIFRVKLSRVFKCIESLEKYWSRFWDESCFVTKMVGFGLAD